MAYIRLVAVVFLLALAANGWCAERKPLISLREVFVGDAWRTRELMLRADGSVVEERYDWSKLPAPAYHRMRVLRRLPREQVKRIIAIAMSQMRALPKIVDEYRPAPIDPESKAIRVQAAGIEVFSGWAAYNDAAPSGQNELFQHVWEALDSLLTRPDA